nr:Glyoxylate reductase [Ipomoea trifida]
MRDFSRLCGIHCLPLPSSLLPLRLSEIHCLPLPSSLLPLRFTHFTVRLCGIHCLPLPSSLLRVAVTNAIAFKVHTFFCQTLWDPLFAIAILATALRFTHFTVRLSGIHCLPLSSSLLPLRFTHFTVKLCGIHCLPLPSSLLRVAVTNAIAFKVHAFYCQTLWDPLCAIVILATACGCH